MLAHFIRLWLHVFRSRSDLLGSYHSSHSTVQLLPHAVLWANVTKQSKPFLRTEDTETASVGAIMAEKSAACCHIQPVCLRSKTYSRMGVMSAVEAMTMRNAKVSTWPSICTTCNRMKLHVQLGDRTEGKSLALQPECHYLLRCLALLDVSWVRACS